MNQAYGERQITIAARPALGPRTLPLISENTSRVTMM